MSQFEAYPGNPLMLTLCLEENSILVSKAILEALDSPKHMQMLINDERRTLLLQACTINDREAVIIPQSSFGQFEMSGHALLRRIRKLTGWVDSHPRVVYGEYVPQHKVIVFDLMLACPAELGMPLDDGLNRPS